MSQEDKTEATPKAPRTQIEDLPRAAKELSEEELEASGGNPAATGYWATSPLIGPLHPAGGATRVENTCTAGNALTGSDRDYGNDMA